VPLWEKGIGVLVVTHEAFTLALRYRDRTDEAETECRAVRHARYTAACAWWVLSVGGHQGGVIAMHWMLLSYAPRYALEGCRGAGLVGDVVKHRLHVMCEDLLDDRWYYEVVRDAERELSGVFGVAGVSAVAVILFMRCGCGCRRFGCEFCVVVAAGRRVVVV
jgi:hypothetical protein